MHVLTMTEIRDLFDETDREIRITRSRPHNSTRIHRHERRILSELLEEIAQSIREGRVAGGDLLVPIPGRAARLVGHHDGCFWIEPQTAAEIVPELEGCRGDAFVFESREVFGRLERASEPAEAIAPLFAFLERYAEEDLGMPGPIVHFLEQLPGCYEDELQRSLERAPSHYTLWMAERLLHVEAGERRSRLLRSLRRIVASAGTPALVEEARGILARQQ